jgi:hypothetical protein
MTEKQFKYDLVMFVKLCNGREWTDWRFYAIHHNMGEAHRSALDFERRNGGSTNVRAKIVHCFPKDIDTYVHIDPKEYTKPTQPNWLIRIARKVMLTK